MSQLRTALGTTALMFATVAGSTITGGLGGAPAAESPSTATASTTAAAAAATAPLSTGEGAAFAMSNATRDNRILSYRRAASGALTHAGSVSTGGKGIGVDLDTQGPLRLSADNRFLYAVNAGSDDVSVFAVDGTKLTLVEKVYAGDQPTSLTIHDNLLYVLDGSVASNSIRGFRRGADGRLTAISGSIQPLSSPIAVPGDIEFSPDGRRILVTEKTTALTLSPSIALDSFAVDGNGVAGAAMRVGSAGIRPFSLAFRNNKQVLVAESFDAAAGRSAVSSYTVTGSGDLTARNTSVANNQTDTCWIIVTHDGKYAYTANFGSGTISQYSIAANGTVTLTRGVAAYLGADSQPVDLAQTADSHYVYLLLRGTGAVASFSVEDGGWLKPVDLTGRGLPVADGASGLAVY